MIFLEVPLSQFAMGIISVGFVGHLGDPQELAGAALATVYANVTGYSVIVSTLFRIPCSRRETACAVWEGRIGTT